MSQNILTFVDKENGVERKAVIDILKAHAGTGPKIRIKLADLGMSATVMNITDECLTHPTIAVYEYDKKYYVLLGQNKVHEHTSVAKSLDHNFEVRLVTKYLMKRAEPATICPRELTDQIHGREPSYENTRNNGYRERPARAQHSRRDQY